MCFSLYLCSLVVLGDSACGTPALVPETFSVPLWMTLWDSPGSTSKAGKERKVQKASCGVELK